MSELVRFQTLNPEKGEQEWLKVLIYERSSRRIGCMVCGQKRFGVLFRGVQPKDGDQIICYECLTLISKRRPIRTADDEMFGFYEVDPTAPVACPICGKEYKPGKGIIGHMNKMHPGADQSALGDKRGKTSRPAKKQAKQEAEKPSDEVAPQVDEDAPADGSDDGSQGQNDSKEGKKAAKTESERGTGSD